MYLIEAIKLIKESSFSNYIAMFSLIVATIALIANIVTNRKNNEQYIESLKPLLAFHLYETKGILLLSVKNTGKTEAKNIKLRETNLKNNGDKKLSLDGLFKSEFMLYPNEEVQGIVAIFGGNIETHVFPVVEIKVSFLNGSNNKTTEYIRTITFKRNMNEENLFAKIEESIESISYSNNRLANYIEGRTLFRFDKLNVHPNSSLYKDMKDAFNNSERKEDTDWYSGLFLDKTKENRVIMVI